MPRPDVPETKPPSYVPLLTFAVVALIALILSLAAGLVYLLRTGTLVSFLSEL
ncbi:MAG: hypothetical protein ACYC4R_05600 [Anaerolineae bacterium]